MKSRAAVGTADLVWRDGQPWSRTFEDIYHDTDGISEVDQVLLAPIAFDELLASHERLMVGELGFGTGLNFCRIAGHCLDAGVRLHFVSVDNAPLSKADFLTVSRARSHDLQLYEELAELYPPCLPGWHRRRLADGRITLSVYWGEVSDALDELLASQRQPFDLLLLDGFAPDRNPGMWQPALFQRLARLSKRGTRVASFTAVGQVRRDLAAVGFRMRRVNQRPRKWESLAGQFELDGMTAPGIPERITIVGAGIAGAAVARELADAGIRVRVMEAGTVAATGASGIPVTVMHPRLHHDDNPMAGLRAAAFGHAADAVGRFVSDEVGVRRTGALQVASPNYPLERLQQVASRYQDSGLEVSLLNAGDASHLSGLALDAPALWFADACLINTPRFTRALLDHPLIELRTASHVNGWPADPTILACGSDTRNFAGAQFLELGTVHGQLDRMPGTPPRVPMVGHGYLAAVIGEPDQLGVGATYEYQIWEPGRASKHNAAHLNRFTGHSAEPVALDRGTRCVSSDRNPVLGALYDIDGAPLEDRWVTTGHGSMGTVTSHLGAAILAAAVLGEVRPLEEGFNALVSPQRFRDRQARRGYRFGATP